MVINNKHVGWGIIVLILLTPFLLSWPFGLKADWEKGNFLAVVQAIDLAITGIVLFIVFGAFIIRLIMDDTTFEWKINFPKSAKKDNSALLRSLAKHDKNSPEFEKIWKELDRRGQWG